MSTLQGEEIEAYIASGVIAHAGLAFSRDGKDKVYIQHKMMQDKKMLAEMLTATGPDAAYFYLCGPTWPVPDVYEALVGSLTEEAGKERKAAENYIEELKEEERYVLEVRLTGLSCEIGELTQFLWLSGLLVCANLAASRIESGHVVKFLGMLARTTLYYWPVDSTMNHVRRSDFEGSHGPLRIVVRPPMEGEDATGQSGCSEIK